MSESMPRPRPPHLVPQHPRPGRTVWYHRIGKGKRTRMPGVYGSPEFTAAYDAAERGKPVADALRGRTGTLRWLWDSYRTESADWLTVLSPATRRQRENIMLRRPNPRGDALPGVLDTGGEMIVGSISTADIEAGKQRRAKTPAQARNYLDCMRGLFGWAKMVGHIKVDPTIGVKNPPKKAGRGFPAWTEADVTAYQKKWPLGTCQRVWLDMLLYVGPRRGDVFTLGKQHLQTVLDPAKGRRVQVIVFRTEKGGEMTEVTIPLLPVLAKTLQAGPCGDLTFIVGKSGRPFTAKESFGNAFSGAARDAGIQKSAHGVRKIAATTAANNGATTAQLMALFGWKTLAMAELYTKDADRRRNAIGAGHTLERAEIETSIPSLDAK